MNNRQKGAVGEQTASEYLIKKGYNLIDKNWHYSKAAEIDLIMQKGDTLIFVEVKSRANLNFGHPFEAITKTKMQNIKLAVQGYLNEHSDLKFKKIQIDGVAIIKDPFSIEHLENIY